MVSTEARAALRRGARRRLSRLEDRGDYRGVIDLLTEVNRTDPQTAVEQELVRLRHEGFCAQPARTVDAAWPPPTADFFGDVDIPVVDRDDLATGHLSSGILRHGCLHVRNFLSAEEIDRFRFLTDAAMEGHDAWEAGAALDETAPWFVPFTPRPEFRIAYGRKWARDAAGVWGVDAPRALFEYLSIIDESRIGSMIAQHLGEQPAISVKKFTLRRVPVDTSADWHQDGAFLGETTKTVNVWVTLTDCGRDAPGLDLVPRRLDGLVDRGTEGAHFDWSVGEPVVQRAAVDAPVVRPEFSAGDAVLFDGNFLHRTATSPDMTRERYAIETWFFAPSTYPTAQIPLLY